MKFKILVLLVILFCTLDAGRSQRYALLNSDVYRMLGGYDWIVEYPTYHLFCENNYTAAKLISEEEVERYSKLKLRNLVKDIKFTTSEELQKKKGDWNYTNFGIYLELYKYNSKLEIYYGLLEILIISTRDGSIWRVTEPIAGSDIQIKSAVKEQIDIMIEIFAEDYYLIQDVIQEDDE